LVRFAERIRIDGAPLEDAALAGVLDEALRVGADLSFFETATLAAFLAFREARVELAIVEVGIGGRLDATNVIPPPRCAALTGIALDHQDMLGETLEAIAREKAAIAKPGAPFVFAKLPDVVRAAAAEVADRFGAHVIDVMELPPGITVGLDGPHQRDNAALAWTVAGQLGIPVPARERGIREVRWPGRLEPIDVASGELAGGWILDGAHNPAGVAALVQALRGTRLGAVIFGALADKSWREMVAVVAEIDAPRFYVAAGGRLPADPAEIAEAVPGTPTRSLTEALRSARRRAGHLPVLVCGSLHLVGEARGALLRLTGDPIVSL
jgi:dihydrofolate synthase/folylpolyglutamate synthase